LLSWLNGIINCWDILKEAFIKRYYPPVKILQNRNNILSFRQSDNENIATTWERLKVMLRTCPSHGVDEWNILHSFNNGLSYMSRSLLDSAAGGAFMTKTISAKAILENMLQNHRQWYTDRAPHTSTRKINSIEEVESLSAKIDALIIVMNKQPNLDNVPLQEFVANNVVGVDVNYIQYFSNNAYGNNYNSGYPRPPFAHNTYGSRPPYVPNTTYATRNNISNDLESTIRSFIATQKELDTSLMYL
jgi:hypothetical protein